jgi:hypothetical protein
MNRKITKGKYLAIPLILLIGLAIAGYAYASWHTSLYIDGTVNTGTLDWQFTTVLFQDGSGNDYHCGNNFTNPPPTQGDKDVGSTYAEIVNPHTVEVNLTNVYPCYFTMVSVYAKNTGTIPFIIDKVIIDGHAFNKTQSPAMVQLDVDSDGDYDIEIWWKNALGTQVHPGRDTDEMSFWIHILQGAPQGETFRFTIELVAIQWNMYGKE